MDSPSISIRVAQGLGITASSFLAGTLFTCSTLAVPPILIPSNNAQTMVTQWQSLFHSGVKMGPTLALLGTANYLFLAYQCYAEAGGRGSAAWKSYLSAAVGTIGIVPYTLLVMNPTNQALLAQTSRLTLDPPAIRALIETWAFLNLIRSCIPMVGTAMGLYGTL